MAEAAERLGITERTFRRWSVRYEAEGAAELEDRRLGRASARAVPVDEALRLVTLYETRYTGCQWDLIVTMDEATSELYSAFFVEEEGTMSSFQGLRDVIETQGLSSLYTDRGSPPGTPRRPGARWPRVG